MESRVKVLGHPIHPMLIVFPLGLLSSAVVFDILYLIYDNPNFPVVSFWMITAGVVTGLAAALFGFVDWLAIPAGTRAKSIGLIHGGGNVVVTLLFFSSWFMRMDVSGYVPSTAALFLSFAGAALAVYTGWLGGELVYRLGMAVDRGAHLDAPSSLSNQPAGVGSRAGQSVYPGALPVTGRPPDEVDPAVDVYPGDEDADRR